jgi:hypothetical protein
MGGQVHIQPNIEGRPIANKHSKGEMNRTSKGVLSPPGTRSIHTNTQIQSISCIRTQHTHTATHRVLEYLQAPCVLHHHRMLDLPRVQLRAGCTVVTLLLYFCITVVTLLLRFCHTIVTPLLRCRWWDR